MVDGNCKLSCVTTNVYSDWSTQLWPTNRLAIRVYKLGNDFVVSKVRIRKSKSCQKGCEILFVGQNEALIALEILSLLSQSVADPGFPRGEGVNPPGWTPTYDFAKFSQKLHEIERIWTLGGGGGGARPKFYYVDPPILVF